MSTNISHEEATERAYIAAAHRENRSEEGRLESLEKAQELHVKRTGSPLHETLEKKDHGPEQPGLAGSEEGRKERAFIAAAHRDGREEDKKLESLKKANELHEERTGEPLPEAVEKEAAHKREEEDKADDEHLAKQERSLIGAAHRKGRAEDGKKESLLKASEIHEERTGEPLPEAVEKGIVDEDGDVIKGNGKRSHASAAAEESDKRQKVDQPGLTASADGRQERAFIAAAHRDGRTEEAKLESLRKANEIHEKRTGEPLVEAVERGLAAQ